VNLPRPSKLRTLLILGRVSNLPTVWADCLAGWWLAGGGSIPALFRVSISVSFLYLGGMFLNDSFDAGFDRNHRPTRPIPSGAITEREVWVWGWAWTILGLAGLIGLGRGTALLALCLSACILFYNAIHKMLAVAPVIMGGCRLLVYLLAGSTGFLGVTGEVVWKGIALAIYVMGLSWLARKESAPVRIQYWPAILLAAPLLIAWLIDDGAERHPAFIASVVLALWVAWTLWQTYGRAHPNVGRAVSRLLAGIALVDLLAVADLSHFSSFLFLFWFGLALFLQEFIPAT